MREMIFSWQKEQWQQVWQSYEAKRLPHALLLSGLTGVGKTAFAMTLVKRLLCSQATPPTSECQCHACHLIATNAHSNVLKIQPEKAGVAIKVDQIREASEFINQTALRAGWRIVVIQSAEAMNINAANALLKTLEEPTPDALLLLISDQYAKLPATILSRCQRIAFPTPPFQQALAWLQQALLGRHANPELLLNLAQGAPLKALALVDEELLDLREQLFKAFSLSINDLNPLQLASALKEKELPSVLHFTISWLMDILRLQLGAGFKRITNQDYVSVLSSMVTKFSVQESVAFIQYLQKLNKEVSTGIHLNKPLFLETIFIRWTALLQSGCAYVSS